MKIPHLLVFALIVFSSTAFADRFTIKDSYNYQPSQNFSGVCQAVDSFSQSIHESKITYYLPYMAYGDSDERTGIFNVPATPADYQFLCECLAGQKSSKTLVPRDLLESDESFSLNKSKYVSFIYDYDLMTVVTEKAKRADISSNSRLQIDSQQHTFLVTDMDDWRVVSLITCMAPK